MRHDSVKYDFRSLFCLHFKNKFRIGLVWLTEWKVFDIFIMLVILGNSVLLAMTDYSDRDNQGNFNQVLNKIDYAFTAVFILEMILKIMAMGFIWHRNAYLRDPWNWLDFLVVIIGIFNLLPFTHSNSNFKSLRVFRVLRPLRSINNVPPIRRLVGSLIKSLPALANVVIFLCFIFILFGIFGV